MRSRIPDAIQMAGAICFLAAAYWADRAATRPLAFGGVVLVLTALLLRSWQRGRR